MPGKGGGFKADAFHQIAVTDEYKCMVIDYLVARAVEITSEKSLCKRHADGGGGALPEGSGGGFDAGGIAMFGVSRGIAAPLAEGLEIIEGDIEAGKIEEGIEQHGTVAGAEHEAIAVVPGGIARVELHVAHP